MIYKAHKGAFSKYECAECKKLQAQIDRAIGIIKERTFCDFNCKNEEGCDECRYIMEG